MMGIIEKADHWIAFIEVDDGDGCVVHPEWDIAVKVAAANVEYETFDESTMTDSCHILTGVFF